MDQITLMVFSAFITENIIAMGAAIIYLAYTNIYKHECSITYVRNGIAQIRNKARFKISQDPEKNEIIKTPFWQGKITMPKPHENFFGVITKRKLYLNLIVPENGKAYALMPNFDGLGKMIKFTLDDRDIMAGAKQELRMAVHKYAFKSQIQHVVYGLMIIAVILISMFNGYFMYKMQKETSAAYLSGSGNFLNASHTIANSITILSENLGIVNGTSANPIPIGG